MCRLVLYWRHFPKESCRAVTLQLALIEWLHAQAFVGVAWAVLCSTVPPFDPTQPTIYTEILNFISCFLEAHINSCRSILPTVFCAANLQLLKPRLIASGWMLHRTKNLRLTQSTPTLNSFRNVLTSLSPRTLASLGWLRIFFRALWEPLKMHFNCDIKNRASFVQQSTVDYFFVRTLRAFFWDSSGKFFLAWDGQSLQVKFGSKFDNQLKELSFNVRDNVHIKNTLEHIKHVQICVPKTNADITS